MRIGKVRDEWMNEVISKSVSLTHWGFVNGVAALGYSLNTVCLPISLNYPVKGETEPACCVGPSFVNAEKPWNTGPASKERKNYRILPCGKGKKVWESLLVSLWWIPHGFPAPPHPAPRTHPSSVVLYISAWHPASAHPHSWITLPPLPAHCPPCVRRRQCTWQLPFLYPYQSP